MTHKLPARNLQTLAEVEVSSYARYFHAVHAARSTCLLLANAGGRRGGGSTKPVRAAGALPPSLPPSLLCRRTGAPGNSPASLVWILLQFAPTVDVNSFLPASSAQAAYAAVQLRGRGGGPRRLRIERDSMASDSVEISSHFPLKITPLAYD